MMNILHSTTVIWLIALVVFLLIEAATQGLTSIWFAGGALGGGIAALLHANIWIQIAVFLILSIILLIATKPLKHRMDKKLSKTNIDSLIGMTGTVISDIPENGTGRVRADGKLWTARSDGTSIRIGQKVVITAIEGVTITVIADQQISS